MKLVFADAIPAMPSSGSFESTLLMLVMVIAFMYFLVYRPEAKRRKQLDAKRSAMKKGDRLVIAGGIVAEFVRDQGSTVIVKLFDGAKMEVLSAAIQDVQTGGSSEKSEEVATRSE
jgi:preprotein translocase subunit YajC